MASKRDRRSASTETLPEYEPFAKRCNTTISFQEPIEYVVLGVAPTKVFMMKTELTNIYHPNWLIAEDKRLYYGDIVNVTSYGPVKEGEEIIPAGSADRVQVDKKAPKPGGKAVVYECQPNDECREQGFVFVDRVARSGGGTGNARIVVADPRNPQKPVAVAAGKVEDGVWARNPRRGSILVANYGTIQGGHYWANQSIMRIPESIAPLCIMEAGFRLDRTKKFDILALEPPIDSLIEKAPLWLKEGQRVDVAANVIAAAGVFYNTVLDEMAATRSFRSKIRVHELDGNLVLQAQCNMAQMQSEGTRTGLVRAHQKGEFIQMKIIEPGETLGDREEGIRLKIIEQILEEDGKSFVITMAVDRSQVEMEIKRPIESLNMMRDAIFGPKVTGSLAGVVRDQLLGGELAQILDSAEENDVYRANLLRLVWGAGGVMRYDLPSVDEPESPLTREQQTAMATIARMTNEVVEVDAKAGSGKTRTVVEATLRWDSQDEEGCMLITSTMNFTIEDIAEKLAAHQNLKMVIMQSATFLSSKSEDDVYHQFRFPALLKDMLVDPNSRKWSRQLTEGEKRTVGMALGSLASMYLGFDFILSDVAINAPPDERRNAVEDALEILLNVYKPNIIIGTLSTVLRLSPIIQDVRTIVVDEAGTTTTIDVIELIVRFKQLMKLSFLGDTKQLLTKAVDVPEQLLILGWQSIFLTLGMAPGVVILPLTRTFRFSTRMVPAISKFCYDNELVGGVPRRGITELLPWKNPRMAHDIVVINIPGEVRMSFMKSRANLDQAKAAAIVARYLRLVHPNVQALVLGFYKLQVEFNVDVDQEIRSDSVDRTQGKEADVVILTTTSKGPNDRGNFGFLEEKRRITVALTRAKEGLVIIADVEAMRQSPCWSKLWETLHDCGVPFVGEEFLIEMGTPAAARIADPSPASLLGGLSLAPLMDQQEGAPLMDQQEGEPLAAAGQLEEGTSGSGGNGPNPNQQEDNGGNAGGNGQKQTKTKTKTKKRK